MMIRFCSLLLLVMFCVSCRCCCFVCCCCCWLLLLLFLLAISVVVGVLFAGAVVADVPVKSPAAWRGWCWRGLAGDTTTPPIDLVPAGAGRCCPSSTL